jgi:hypothetical protein
MVATDVQLLHHLDDDPALLVFLSPRRFELMTPAAACKLRDQLQAALASVGWVERGETHQCQPEQLTLIDGDGDLPWILQRQMS